MAVSFYRSMIVRTRQGTYRELRKINPVLTNGELLIVTNIPGWWRRRKTRIKVGDGKTPFNKLRYV